VRRKSNVIGVAAKETRVTGVKRFLLFLLYSMIIFSGLGHQPAHCQDQQGSEKGNSILSLGMAKIIDDNIAAAKQKAVSSAIERGVEHYLVRRLGEKAAAEYLDRLVEGVIPRANELVENYYIVREAQVGDHYALLLQIKVNEKLAGDRLQEAGLLQTETRAIKLLFLVGEEEAGKLKYWWSSPDELSPLNPTELALFRAFQDKGFDLINRTVSLPPSGVSAEMRRGELDLSSISKWGEVFDADVVLYGKSLIGQDGGISVAFQVVRVSDGTEYCQLTQAWTGGSAQSREEIVNALDETIRQMMPRLESCIEEAGGAVQQAYSHFVVTLKGLESYVQYKRLRDFISKEIPGVKRFTQSRIGSHFVSFEVEFQGDKNKFANLVMYHDGLPVPIKGVEQQGDEVTLLIGQ